MSASFEVSGAKVLVMGPAGSGKTTSVKTAVDWAEATGRELFFFGLERQALESLLKPYVEKSLPIPSCLHWHIIDQVKTSFSAQLDMAQKVNTLGMDAVAKITDPNRTKFSQFRSILTVLNNFTCQRTGKSFGDVSTWDAGKILVIDHLTVINNASIQNAIGGKVVRSQQDWQVGQNQIEHLLTSLTQDCPCHLIMLSHVERQTDEVLGGVKLMVSTLGKALAPKIPAMFSEVVLAAKANGGFVWDTASPIADTKNRYLPASNTNPQDFGKIFTLWEKLDGAVTAAIREAVPTQQP